MARRKPPAHVYNEAATLRVCTGTDRYQRPTFDDYPVSGVNLQSTNETRKTSTNTEVLLRSVAFFDSVYTTPQLDLDTLKTQSEAKGHSMQLLAGNDTYTVMTVDSNKNEYGELDHYEVGLV